MFCSYFVPLLLSKKPHHALFPIQLRKINGVFQFSCGYVDDYNFFVGKLIHGIGIKLGLDLNVVVGTVLLDMYVKSDCLRD